MLLKVQEQGQYQKSDYCTHLRIDLLFLQVLVTGEDGTVSVGFELRVFLFVILLCFDCFSNDYSCICFLYFYQCVLSSSKLLWIAHCARKSWVTNITNK